MANLEDLIRNAAKEGQLTHLSVVPIAGKGPAGISWSASFSPGSVFGTGFGVDIDPVEAIKLAMTDKRLGRLVGKLDKALAEAPPEEVKAAAARVGVKPPAPNTVDDSEFA